MSVRGELEQALHGLPSEALADNYIREVLYYTREPVELSEATAAMITIRLKVVAQQLVTLFVLILAIVFYIWPPIHALQWWIGSALFSSFVIQWYHYNLRRWLVIKKP